MEKKGHVKRYKWKRFKLVSPLGKGSFGEIWMGILRKEKMRVAIKFERHKKKQKHFWLQRESEILKTLQEYKIENITKLIWFGKENGFNVMVMKVYGDSLLDIKSIHRKFSLKTVLMIGIQLIEIIEKIHDCGVIHCDLKPSNLLFKKKDHEFVLIDFGLAKRFINEEGDHIEYRKKKKGNNSITGTALFCSINTHLGNLSRRDDMESIGMMMIYLLNGRLPWQGIRGETKYEKYFKIYKKKVMTQTSFLKDMEEEFKQYFNYVRKLEFKQKPDYEYCKNLFHYLMIKKKLKRDGIYDFTIKKKIEEVEEEEEGEQTPVYYVREETSFWSWLFS